MPDFLNYIQPLIEWLRVNPQWSFFITFFISMLESLAIIGSIVPGSVTMTALGILAGSGVMAVDLTLIAATLGAMVGDNLSYAIGYYYRDNLKQIWPFSRYPGWVDYGGDFFKKHGGKSVFIGRFVGPLRSLIPVIAGMMRMKQGRFFVANFLSAVLWSIGHIMPGVLIGSASSELSTEAATRLFLLVLLALVVIWLASFLLKWTILKIRRFFKVHLHEFWLGFKRHPLLFYCFKAITPEKEVDHFSTVSLFLLTIFCTLFCIFLILLSAQGQWVKAIDVPIQWLMESTRTSALDSFFIACTQLTSLATISSFFIFFFSLLLIKKDYNGLRYLISLVFFSTLIPFLLSLTIAHPRPPGLLVTMPGSAFPNFYLALASSLYSVAMLCVTNQSAFITNTLRSFILIVLGLSGLAAVYLGDYWFSDVLASYFIGFSICLIHWIAYRKTHLNLNHKVDMNPVVILSSILVLLLGVTTLSTIWNNKKLMHNHTLTYHLYFLKEDQWWNQQPPLLPFYKYNRLGRIIGLFNIQYSGDLIVFKQQLETHGWKERTDSFFQSVIKHMDSQKESINLPLLPQLYLNRKPELIMTLKNESADIELILRMWESNYFLEETGIWIGSIEFNLRKKENNSQKKPKELNPLSYLKPALGAFLVRPVVIAPDQIKTTPEPIEPLIYLIKIK